MKKRKSAMKKVLSLTLSMVMACAVMMSLPQASMQVQAAPPETRDVNLGTGGIENPNNTGDDTTSWTGSKVYFGGRECFVLDKNGGLGGRSSLSGHMLLLTANTIGDKEFDNADPKESDWSDSTIRKNLNDTTKEVADGGFIKTLTATEQNNITAFSISNTNTESGITTFPTGSEDKIFLLDVQDVNNVNYGFVGLESRKIGAGSWWLRSAGVGNDLAAVVRDDGKVIHGGYNVAQVYGVRPAFNLNLSSVLFTSAVAGGKSSFAEVGTTHAADNKWKLTLKDGNNGFTASRTDDGNLSGGTKVTVNVSDIGTSGTGVTYTAISGMLTDANGTVLCYGKANEMYADAGDYTFDIPASVTAGANFYVFAETANQISGSNNRTDYASKMALVYSVPAPGGSGTPSTIESNPQIERPDLWREFIKATLLKISTAKEGEKITIDFGGFNALTLSVMKQMAMRRDLTIKMVYYYKGAQYNLTFPVGMPINYSEDIPYYGPLKLADMTMRDGGVCQIR